MGVLSMIGNLFQAGYAGWQSGIAAARRVYEDPATAYQQENFANRAMEYTLLWSYYNNSMFEKLPRMLNTSFVGNLTGASWGTYNPWNIYRQNYNLYREIRLIYNPTRRLVDFYAGQVYPGVLSEDGSKLPDGVQLAIPFSEDTHPAIKSAVAQFWQWSNWQAKKALHVRFGAALGSVLIELVDDLAAGRIVADIVWPGFIYDLDLDYSGVVKSYRVRYQAVSEDAGAYLFEKQVDLDAIRYFKNGEPFDYGYGAVVENPYGFVPALWVKHLDVGGDHGSPAIAGSFGKIDELNNLVSHVHDQIHKVIGAPALISGPPGNIEKLFGNTKRGPTADFTEPASDQESVLLIKAPQGTTVAPLIGNLNLADATQYITNLQAEIEHDHPELVFYKELRAMSQVTGPAASRLVGDVQAHYSEVAAGYDMYSIQLFQMALMMAGFRANSGAWGMLSDQQKKFLPFNLDSLKRGDLDMAIMPRPLLTPTRMEIGQENELMWRGVAFGAQAGVPAEVILREAGWTDDKITQLQQASVQKQQQQQADVIPPVQQ